MVRKVSSSFVALVLAVGLCPGIAFANQAGSALSGAQVASGSAELQSQAASARSVFEDYTSSTIRYFKYLNKAQTRAVAITGDSDGQGGIKSAEVWFINGSYVQYLYSPGYSSIYGGSPKLSTVKGGKIFSFEQGGYGSGSTTFAWFIHGGTAQQIPSIGMSMKQVKGNKFSIVRQAFDATVYSNGHSDGHTYNAYYYRWNGKKFIEYGGKAMTQKQLKKAKNGTKVLKAIKRYVKKNYGVAAKIGKIYYRANGIVNVNFTYKRSYGKSQANVKLNYKSGKLSYAKVWANRPSALERAMQGGLYKARGGSQTAGSTGVSYAKLPAKLR